MNTEVCASDRIEDLFNFPEFTKIFETEFRGFGRNGFDFTTNLAEGDGKLHARPFGCRVYVQ
jgi:hypothetical protein